MALIDLDFSLKAIEEYKLCQCKSKYTTENECLAARHGMDLAKMVLHNVPTVEAKPVVHAHWISKFIRESTWSDDDYAEEVYNCSNCNMTIEYNTPYCPYCGAQMDEVME